MMSGGEDGKHFAGKTTLTQFDATNWVAACCKFDFEKKLKFRFGTGCLLERYIKLRQSRVTYLYLVVFLSPIFSIIPFATA